MFTGIIEAVAKIKEIKEVRGNKLLKIESPWEINPGDSISIDGACLTVKEYKTDAFLVEATEETVKTTLIQNYKRGDLVNLERALPIDGRLGGHFVAGHIDERGKIRATRKYQGYQSFEIEVSRDGMRYVVEKGSIAVNGISLTIVRIKHNSFLINIIPYTLEHTDLSYKKVGDFVNVEFDYLSKLVYKYLKGSYASFKTQNL